MDYRTNLKPEYRQSEQIGLRKPDIQIELSSPVNEPRHKLEEPIRASRTDVGRPGRDNKPFIR